MSIPYEETGRTRQKARTRKALVDAARELIAEGVSPSVEQVADRADISRTTAYRYFPSQRSLLAAAYPVIEAKSLLGADPPEDPSARLQIATRALLAQVLENEQPLRTMWQLSLDSPAAPEQLLLRRGRAIGWIEDALAPLRGRLTDARLRRLAISIRAAAGIEPLVWLTDIAGLSREEAVDLMCGTADALLQAALSELTTG
jgi:AcrR family transcriptional regulator